MTRYRLERLVPQPGAGGFSAPIDGPREFRVIEVAEGHYPPSLPGLKVEQVSSGTELVPEWTAIPTEEEETP